MPDRFGSILSAFPERRLLVIGDLMLDEFLWGTVSRISPEAPVPVVKVTGESYYPGGAANVARNLHEFTPHVAVAGMAGDDAAGCHLMELLRSSGIDTAAVCQANSVQTTVKTRIIARNQQVVRVDRERRTPLEPAGLERAMTALERAIPAADAVIVADYGKGFLSQPLADHICREVRAHGKILAIDPHPYTSLIWPEATAVKPNRTEAFLAAAMPPADPAPAPLEDAALLEVGERLLRMWRCGLLLITLGEQGMLLFEPGRPPYHIPTSAKEVFDVSGAGDTGIAVLTMALACGAGPRPAAELANCASGIAVGKLGTATVSFRELEAAAAAL
jgi:D-glycero-beta-D-manno-heptose-7-phosphate kinase